MISNDTGERKRKKCPFASNAPNLDPDSRGVALRKVAPR